MNENVNVKKGKGSIIVIILLIIIVLGLTSYIVYDKVVLGNQKEEKEETKKEEKFVYPAKQEGFLKMDEQIIKLNNKEHRLITYYYSNKRFKNIEGESKEFYSLEKEVFLDSKKVINLHAINNSEEEINEKDTKYDIENTRVEYINDTESNDQYVLLTDGEYASKDSTTTSTTVLFDKDGYVLHTFLLRQENTGFAINEKDISTNYEGYMYHNYNDEIHNLVSINKDYIYYIDLLNCTVSDKALETGQSYDEYLLTVANGKVNKVKVATYDSTKVQAAGGIPQCTIVNQ